MKFLSLLSIAISLSSVSYPQNSVTGTLTALAGQQIKLAGFDGFITYVIDSIKASPKGNFTLSYGKNDYGLGCLVSGDNKPFIVILAPDENLILEGETLSLPETVEIQSGTQNKLFEQYSAEHPRREQALSAWDFLDKIYSSDPLFASHKKPGTAIDAERERLKKEDETFLAGTDPEYYVSWYLPVRKLVSSVPTIAQYRTEEIPVAIAAFRKMDYKDPRLFKSGMLGETIEAHFWLIENSGRALDSVYIEMMISIDHLINNLIADERKLNLITGYLFELLEKRSLFEASEYLALKMLNETRCTIDNNLSAQMESYRSMKKGTTAPDFGFPDDLLAPGYSPDRVPSKLSGIRSNYTLVIFGASWCPTCPDELFQIVKLYDKWRKHGVEVVFVSLDEDRQTFRNFASIFPFISICDYRKWDSPIVKAWYVSATPTLYLLNDRSEILLRPNSVSHADSWVEWYLVQGTR